MCRDAAARCAAGGALPSPRCPLPPLDLCDSPAAAQAPKRRKSNVMGQYLSAPNTDQESVAGTHERLGAYGVVSMQGWRKSQVRGRSGSGAAGPAATRWGPDRGFIGV